MSRIAEAPTVRIGNVGALPSVFAGLGVDLKAGLRSAGLGADSFCDPERIVPYRALDELIAYGARESGCDHIGLLIGGATPDLGLASFLLVNAPTVRDGLRDLVAGLDRADAGSVTSLTEAEGVATLSYSLFVSGLKASEHIYDCAIAIGYGLLARLLGSDFEPSEIRLPRRPPAQIAPYRTHFSKGRLSFNCKAAAIAFPVACLDRHVPNADAALYRFLKKLLAQHGPRLDPSMASQVRRVLPGLVRREPANQEAIARMFGMHPRTMSRRLAEEQMTLQELVEEARFEAARQLLRESSLGLTKIAADLHYSDASAFARAFRRKFGIPPGAWRAAQSRRIGS